MTETKQYSDASMREMAGEEANRKEDTSPIIEAGHVNPITEAMTPPVRELVLRGVQVLQKMEKSNGFFDANQAVKAAADLRDAFFKVQYAANAAPSIARAHDQMTNKDQTIEPIN